MISVALLVAASATVAICGPPHGLYRQLPIAKVYVDGTEVQTDVPAVILDGRTMVPLRAIAEMSGADVEWDPQAYAIRITKKASAPQESAVSVQEAVVTRIVDGDTVEVKLAGKSERVRFIGVDCPESGTELGQAATAYTRRALEGKRVYLETDLDTRDKYGRLLAYVWLSPPATVSEQTIRSGMFNAQLLLAGMAQLMTVPPNVKYVDYFTGFQREAREAGVGLWASEAPQPTDQQLQQPPPQQSGSASTTVYITRTGSKYHRAGCRYLSKSAIPISLEEAKARGYTPCTVCNPPR